MAVACAAASRALQPVGEVLPVPGEDEQRVVDADGEAEHRGQRRRGLGQVDTPDSAVTPVTPMPTPISAVSSGRPAASSEPSVIARTTKPISMPALSEPASASLGDEAAAELDLQARGLGGLGRGVELVAGRVVDLVGGHGVDHVGEADAPSLVIVLAL